MKSKDTILLEAAVEAVLREQQKTSQQIIADLKNHPSEVVSDAFRRLAQKGYGLFDSELYTNSQGASVYKMYTLTPTGKKIIELGVDDGQVYDPQTGRGMSVRTYLGED